MSPTPTAQRYPMAPLIRFTLLALYLALVLPLPVLAPPSLCLPLLLAAIAGLLLVVAITSERVELDERQLRVGHPPWCSWLLRRGWQLPWDRITALTPVTTSQGGRVYYVRTASSEGERSGAAWLLPQRVARFEDFLEGFSAATGIATEGIGRISPPWTYRLLALLCGLLLAGEAAALILRPA
ncbi:hypothetical protein KBZ08_11415 [Cyanobium sp. Candia 9D4]|uniref:hypothetical protein n=1 Tax=Cyanobium sp. Candia 9D4 TaxID=2823707 RepID=UPI0020CFB554|nr:hypothetical protein [Cyanobium sp. Candia 9D4]MCP9934518.1 hypothetical protein [Cyanobium sp. Candia 9D4]